MLYKHIKRIFDIVISIVAFVILLPFFLICVIMLFIVNGNPFFTQLRPGKDAKLFRIIKLKTMTDERDIHGELLPDSKRLTATGKFIRRLSIDEIPQLVNVVMGDMSLVGPRPLLTEYLPYYDSKQHRRHEVKPGITGWAQVNGRNAISWPQKFDYDIWYIDNLTWRLDFKILILTVKKVFFSEGVSAKGHVTMPTFIDYILESKMR